MNYFVLGLGLTGISTIKTLSKLGNKVYGYDENLKDLNAIDEKLQGCNYEIIKNIDELDLKKIDTVVKSPGIPLTNLLVKSFLDLEVEVISDLELAYRLFPDRNLVAITGTNGKTTTTMLLTHIINSSEKKAIAIGNIGIGMLWEIYSNPNIDFYVIECSSFQLATVNTFRTKVAGLTNISVDHLDWHGSFREYVEAKSNIFKKQKQQDCLVINCDDEKILEITKNIEPKIFKTSTRNNLEEGIFLEGDYIFYNNKILKEMILDKKELKIVGNHNIQNTLIAIAMAVELGISIDDIRTGCKTFTAVEHRIEFVKEVNNVKYYNDSKGTNIDATIKAITSFENPINLIAGGYDKKIEFDDLFKNFPSNIKTLILLGETRELMKKTAEKYGFNDIYLVGTMEEAVEKASNVSRKDDVVLLSPANASWGMYKSYIERGNHFKKLVNEIR